jgi:hypothetical protein
MLDSSSSYQESKSGYDSNSNCNNHNNDEKFHYSLSEINALSISELKNLMRAFQVDFSGCLERSDLILRIEQCDNIFITND